MAIKTAKNGKGLKIATVDGPRKPDNYPTRRDRMDAHWRVVSALIIQTQQALGRLVEELESDAGECYCFRSFEGAMFLLPESRPDSVRAHEENTYRNLVRDLKGLLWQLEIAEGMVMSPSFVLDRTVDSLVSRIARIARVN